MQRKILLTLLGLFCLAITFFAVNKQVNASAAAQAASDPKVFFPIILNPGPLPLPGEPGYCLTMEEAKLAALTNEYRRANGLPDAPLSRSLSTVAQWHVKDLQLNNPNSGTDSRGQACNMHSWSNKGFWSPVCYTPDHYYASGMWLKPKEITRGIYTEYGYEIAARVIGADISAERALNAWKKSAGHNNVILEQGGWEGYQWPAMGIGIYKSYAVIWFGEITDPAGSIPACN